MPKLDASAWALVYDRPACLRVIERHALSRGRTWASAAGSR